MRYTFHDLVYIGLFGALWALVDTWMGPLLVVHDVVFFSAVLAAAGIALALTGRSFVLRPGSLVLMACFALVLKFAYAGGFISTPVLRILSPAIVAEVTLLLAERRQARRTSMLAYVVAGVLAVLWTLAQSFLFPAIFAPQGLKMVYALTLIRGAKLLHSTTLGPAALLALAGAAHLLLGGLAGLAAWVVGAAVHEDRQSPRASDPNLSAARRTG